jgi:hypothetical protein
MCHATSLPDEGPNNRDSGPVGDGGLSVSLKARPVPGTDTLVEFAILDGVDLSDAAVVAGVLIDGRSIDVQLTREAGLYRLEGKAAKTFIAAARRGVSVSLVDVSGRPVAAASLFGLRKALSFIDRRQGRIATREALAEPGKRPWNQAAAPQAIKLAPVRTSARSSRPPIMLGETAMEELAAQDPCASYAPDASADPPTYHRLDRYHTLLRIPTRCGGYNPSILLFVIDEAGTPRKPRFWPYPGNDMEQDPDLPDASYDDGDRRLSTFGRGRSMADCGEAAEYVWDRVAFSLVSFRSIYPCRGSYDYITTWRREIIVEQERVSSLQP